MFRKFVPALALAFCLTAAPAAAQQPQLENISKKKNGAWTLECGSVPNTGARICQMSQVANDPNTNNPVIQAAVIQPNPNREPVLRLIAPLGIWLRPGVGLSIDGGAPTTVNFEFCMREGCIAQLPLSPALVSAMKAGKAASLTVRDIRRRSVTVNVSLSGFTASFNGLSG